MKGKWKLIMHAVMYNKKHPIPKMYTNADYSNGEGSKEGVLDKER